MKKLLTFFKFIDRLFQYISDISGDLNLGNSNATSLGNLERVEGNASLGMSEVYETMHGTKVCDRPCPKLRDLGNLREVCGKAYINNPNIDSLGKLEKVGKELFFKKSNVHSFSNLQEVGGYIAILGLDIKDAGNLKSVGAIWHDNCGFYAKGLYAVNFSPDAPGEDDEDDFELF